MRTWWKRLAQSETGATAIEYGLIIAVLIVVMMAGMTTFGQRMGTLWGNMASTIVNS